MTTTTEQRARLRELCEKATAWPWWNESCVIHAKAPEWTDECHRCVHPAHAELEDDADLIAESRNALPALLDDVERLMELLAKMRRTAIVLTHDDLSLCADYRESDFWRGWSAGRWRKIRAVADEVDAALAEPKETDHD